MIRWRFFCSICECSTYFFSSNHPFSPLPFQHSLIIQMRSFHFFHRIFHHLCLLPTIHSHWNKNLRIRISYVLLYITWLILKLNFLYKTFNNFHGDGNQIIHRKLSILTLFIFSWFSTIVFLSKKRIFEFILPGVKTGF